MWFWCVLNHTPTRDVLTVDLSTCARRSAEFFWYVDWQQIFDRWKFMDADCSRCCFLTSILFSDNRKYDQFRFFFCKSDNWAVTCCYCVNYCISSTCRAPPMEWFPCISNDVSLPSSSGAAYIADVDWKGSNRAYYCGCSQNLGTLNLGIHTALIPTSTVW